MMPRGSVPEQEEKKSRANWPTHGHVENCCKTQEKEMDWSDAG